MNVYENLEFDIILSNVAALASSDVVSSKILHTEPTSDIETARKLLTQTGDAMAVLSSHRLDLCFEDILPSLAKVRVGATLTPAELLKIKNGISNLRALKSCVEDEEGYDSLKDITAYARPCDELERAIGNAVESDTEIKDSASDKLYSLRRAIVKANAALKERLDGYTRQSEISKYLQDNIVTLRGGRYVLPVRSDSRSHVKGLVHDVSATGATVFIEPFAVIDANNEIIALKNEEANEIERILAELSSLVLKNGYELTVGQDVLTECGIIFAKAEYAKQQNAYCPQLNTEGKIVLKAARHPMIDPAVVVPIDISLDQNRILLISGPNTGGKTVALKTVGLFALLAASGMFVPAKEGSILGIFTKIYCDIGDSQSIAQSLSTFSAHIAHLSEITNGMDNNSLVLLDEVGDGTDPDEGAALAIAVIKKIVRANSTAVITTHFNSVKEFALGNSAVTNACMQFDSTNLRPTYKLLQGVSGSSYALEIAERLGLGSDVISDARAELSEQKISFDRIIREAEDMRNQVLSEKQQYDLLLTQAQTDREDAKRLKDSYEQKLKQIIENSREIVRRSSDEYTERAERIIEQLKEKLKSADQAALFEARKIAKQLQENIPYDEIKPDNADSPVSPTQLTTGTEVYISGLNKQGIVTGAPRGNKVVVAIGSIKTEIPISSLTVIKPKQTKPVQIENNRIIEPENREVMLIGKTVDEAIAQLDLIIPDLPPHSTLRIVHGKGTGTLGKGIQSYLRKLPKIKSFRYGRYGEGDTGVTIVEIK